MSRVICDAARATTFGQRLRILLREYSRGLVFQVASKLFLVGLVVSFLFTLVALWYVGSFETRRETERIGELYATVSRTLSIACFTNDKLLAEEVVSGLLSNRLIADVKVISGTEDLVDFKHGPRVGTSSTIRVQRKVFSPFDENAAVGEVVLVADADFIAEQASDFSHVAVTLLVLEVLIGTLVVAFGMLGEVVMPIRTLVGGLRRIQSGREKRLPLSGMHLHAELLELGEAFNEMIDSKEHLLGVEQAMREQVAGNERQLQAILDNSPDMIVRYDRECRLVLVNQAYLHETGALAEEVVGQPFSSARIWQQPTMQAEVYRQRLWDVMVSGNPDKIPLEWVSADGRLACHEMNVVPEYDSAGRIVGALGVGRNITDRKRAEQELRHQAMHDALTGLPNRTLLKDRIRQGIAQVARDECYLGLVFIDLDNFKSINDTLGHDCGDELLKQLGARMQSVLRNGDTVARLGGDEFVLVLQDVAHSRDVETVVKKVFAEVAQPCLIAGRRLYPGASMGVAIYPKDGADADSLMRSADTAMYAAKGQGRNNYQFFSQEMDESLHEWVTLNNCLRQAIELNQFELHYQPKQDLRTGAFSGMEALIRWRHPERGMVSPAVFIPVAEKSGQIVAIGNWVLDEACRQIRAWLDRGLDPVRVAVNLSVQQCQDPSLPEQLERLLRAYRLSGSHLEVEITESMVMADAEQAIHIMWGLRELGVRLSMDDFGTGYSSLSYLKRLPIDTLKIDKSFVNDIETDPNDVAIINAVIAMAHSLGLQVVAEGVEEKRQSELLREFGCDYLQGYLYSKPLSAADMDGLLRSTCSGLALPEPVAQ
jgi:diguanylate cyclase (GGDEF)-like protein/PAS domain S-box-containing protein